MKFGIKDFLEDREYKNLSIHTLSSYKRTLEEFHEFCTKYDIVNVEDVNSQHVKKYLMDRRKKGNNTTTTNSKLKHLRVFFGYLTGIEVIQKNPAKTVEMAKQDVKIEVFSDYHIQQMLNYYRRMKARDKSFFAYRNYVIILTLLGTGIRLGELCNLKWDDVNFDNETMIIFGKKRQQTSIPVAIKLLKELAEYRAFCDKHFRGLGEYVFVSTYNRKLSENAVKCVFKRLQDVMNFRDVRLSAHTFRHTFAHRYITAGGDVFSLQKLLRHSDLSTTSRYLALWGTALKEQSEKFNPLNHMDL